MDKIRICGGKPLLGKIRIGGAKNAALYAASIISNYDPNIERSLVKWRLAQTKKVKKTPR